MADIRQSFATLPLARVVTRITHAESTTEMTTVGCVAELDETNNPYLSRPR